MYGTVLSHAPHASSAAVHDIMPPTAEPVDDLTRRIRSDCRNVWLQAGRMHAEPSTGDCASRAVVLVTPKQSRMVGVGHTYLHSRQHMCMTHQLTQQHTGGTLESKTFPLYWFMHIKSRSAGHQCACVRCDAVAAGVCRFRGGELCGKSLEQEGTIACVSN